MPARLPGLERLPATFQPISACHAPPPSAAKTENIRLRVQIPFLLDSILEQKQSSPKKLAAADAALDELIRTLTNL